MCNFNGQTVRKTFHIMKLVIYNGIMPNYSISYHRVFGYFKQYLKSAWVL